MFFGCIQKIAGRVLKHQNIGSYVNDVVPSLESFSMYNNPPIVALSSAMQYLERWNLSFKPDNLPLTLQYFRLQTVNNLRPTAL